MENLRLKKTIAALFLIIFCGWLMLWTLEEDCAGLSRANCRFLWVLAGVSILGGALLVETWYAYKKARGEWRVRAQYLAEKKPILSDSQVWFRAVVRVILTSLLLGFPLITRAAFGITVFGAFIGLGISSLVRAIMNWLPLVEDDTEI